MKLRLAVLLIFLPALAHALPINLAWDPNPPGELVTAYRLGDCTQGTTTCTTIGETSALTYTIDVATGVSKCFRVMAINNLGVTSDWSTEVCVQPTKPSAVNKWRVILYVPK